MSNNHVPIELGNPRSIPPPSGTLYRPRRPRYPGPVPKDEAAAHAVRHHRTVSSVVLPLPDPQPFYARADCDSV